MAQEAAKPADNAAATTKSGEEMTEILVTGIRKALQTSQDLKRDADTVIDSITATDIGAFPDKSVAEALQRMTGVTVNRFAASGDTSHFSAEPSGVVIRGLPQVRSEFNGRDSFNANSSRGLSFGDVSPELMAGVDTYKNATADMIEGGIAGTVNLRTRVPFDSEGFTAAFSAELGYGTLSEETKPAASMLLSNRWDSGIGEFGVMLNAAYSEVVTESQGVQLLRFFNATDVAAYGGGTKWIPGGIDIRENTYNRTRKGGSFATQWKSPNDSLLATLQYNRSEYQNDWEEYSMTAGVGNSQQPQGLVLNSEFARHPTGTPAFEFDSRGVFVRGVINDVADGWAGPTNNATIAHPDGYRQGSATNSPDWVCYSWGGSTNKPCPDSRGAGLSVDTRSSRQTNTTEDLSLNLRWDVNERLGLNFDVQKIWSEVVNFDNSADDKTAADITLDISGNKPRFSFSQPTGYGWTAGGFSDPQNYFHEWQMEHAENSDGTELAARIDADIHLDKGWLDSLRVGVRSADRDQNVNWSTYNWGSVQPLWGLQGDVPFFLNQSFWQGTYIAKDLGPNLVGGGVFDGGTFLHPRFDIVDNYGATRALYGNGRSNSWVALGERACADPSSPGGLYCPVEMLDVTEDTRAAYVMLKFGNEETKLGNISVRGNIGVRWVKTDVSSTGGAQFPLYQAPSPPTPEQPAINPRSLATPEDIAFMNQGSYFASAGASHTNMLPSLNVRFGLTDDQFVRFAASRALSRADMGLYKYYYTVGVDQGTCADGTVTWSTPGDCTSAPVAWTPRYTADTGNPRLKPTTADQLDLTYEWYFSSVGSFTAAVFYKKFNDYIIKASEDEQLTNNGVTRTVNVTRPVNADGAKVTGAEVAYQTFFDRLPEPWNGLGIQANYTYVDNQGVNNSGLTIVSGGGTVTQDANISFTDLPLEGFSKSAYNVVLMFEKQKFSARLAYNWRDQFLQTQADCCIKLPIWQKAYGQLDASFHYRPGSSWDIFLDAQNVLEEESVLLQQVNQDGLLLPRSWFTNDMRLQMGVRYRFQ
ncbi:MAG TPA: TonB-dependent receptor [Steroidobacteraceae bacterium]|jgi:TonB-dependent receptor|nr:TonB-dependent receptor [Steroidobacteraceae bacterium]